MVPVRIDLPADRRDCVPGHPRRVHAPSVDLAVPAGKFGPGSDFPTSAADPPSSTADQLEKLASLRDRDVVTAEEFQQGKARILA